jgi:hypothetical protein
VYFVANASPEKYTALVARVHNLEYVMDRARTGIDVHRWAHTDWFPARSVARTRKQTVRPYPVAKLDVVRVVAIFAQAHALYGPFHAAVSYWTS